MNLRTFIISLLLGINLVIAIVKPIGKIDIHNSDIKAFFSLHDDCTEKIVDELKKSKSSIYFAIYNFTDIKIATSLLEAHKRGVSVKGVIDRSSIKYKFPIFEILLKNGVDIRVSARSGIMHHKFVLIDENTIITGSFNWSAAANKRNSENIVIIKNKNLGELFYKEFKRILWKSDIIKG